MRLDLHAAAKAAFSFVWRAAVVLFVYAWVVGVARADEPGFTCNSDGRRFKCASHGAAELKTLPKWIFHTKPSYATFGLDFPPSPAPMPAPDQWTVLEMRTFPDDQTDAPYDGVIYQSARTWVRRCGSKAVFAVYRAGLKPPSCP